MPCSFMMLPILRLDATTPLLAGAALIFLAPWRSRLSRQTARTSSAIGSTLFGFQMFHHPVVGGAGNAQYPALRRYRAAGGVGPHHACFRANTGAACSGTSTSIPAACCASPARPARFARACGCRRPWWSRRRGCPAPTGAAWNGRCRIRP